MSDWGDKFYNSNQWKRIRKNVLQRDHGLCQECLRYGLVNAAEIVHHKIELNAENVNDPSVALNEKNLISVCRECHKQIHNKTQHRRYKIDEDGNIIDAIEDNKESFIDETRVSKSKK